MVIGFSERYWLAALRTRARSIAATFTLIDLGTTESHTHRISKQRIKTRRQATLPDFELFQRSLFVCNLTSNQIGLRSRNLSGQEGWLAPDGTREIKSRYKSPAGAHFDSQSVST